MSPVSKMTALRYLESDERSRGEKLMVAESNVAVQQSDHRGQSHGFASRKIRLVLNLTAANDERLREAKPFL